MNEIKYFVCDSGVLISLSSSCILDKIFNLDLKLVIPPAVYYESITHPSIIKRYKFEANRIKKHIDNGNIILKAPLKTTKDTINDLLNNLLYFKNKPLKLFHGGEIECLALIKDFGYEYLLIDEKTTRLTFENIDLLKGYLFAKKHIHIKINKKNLHNLRSYLGDFKIFRSADICVYAFYKGIFNCFGKSSDTLDGILWSLKLNGCAISKKEIDEYCALFDQIDKVKLRE